MSQQGIPLALPPALLLIGIRKPLAPVEE